MFEVNPNPAGNFINISSSVHVNPEILITDMLGKEQYHQTKVMMPLQINTSQLPDGMYNIILISDEGITNKKFIISR
jgi:hypothetical protein